MSARKVATIVILSAICVFVLSYVILFGYISHLRAHLLSQTQTDHLTLLAACRELSQQAQEAEMCGVYQVRFNGGNEVVSEFPKPILDLKPSYVVIRPDASIMIEMVGGLVHFGVRAYPEGFIEPTLGFT